MPTALEIDAIDCMITVNHVPLHGIGVDNLALIAPFLDAATETSPRTLQSNALVYADAPNTF
jgi:hypothetical protein